MSEHTSQPTTVLDPDGDQDTGTGPVELAGGRHPVNVVHLVMGLMFLGIVAVWALVEGGIVDDVDVRWLLPVPWLVAGGAGLIALVAAGRRRRA